MGKGLDTRKDPRPAPSRRQQLGATGGYVPLGADELCETWQKLRSSCPAEFGGTP
jgi:hypothetical protein